MSPLPKPLSQRPTGMPQMRRKSGLRTAAGTLQEQFLERVGVLVQDPTVVLPQCLDGEPRPLARLRRQLEAVAKGRTPLAARFDRQVLAAVVAARKVAGRDAVPRLMDAKVAGQRRFYLQVGHVKPTCTLGVQNHDEPRVLLLAYIEMAKHHGLHFFAGEELWCSGKTPRPPAAWIAGLTEGGNVVLDEVPAGPASVGEAAAKAASLAGWSCGHTDRPRVRLTWPDGPFVEACVACSERLAGLHRRLKDGYLGPNVRKPFEVEVRLPDGTVHAPGREDLAKYRAGLIAEAEVAAEATAAWRRSGAARWALGDRRFATLDAFLDAISPEAWERPVLARLVGDGYVAASTTVSTILDERRVELGAALAVHVDDGVAFAQARSGMAARDLVRAAHDEARRRAAASQLPAPTGAGVQGQWIDALARALVADGRTGGLAHVRRAMEAPPVPRSTLFAFLHAVGGALDLESRFTADEKEAAQALLTPAAVVLAARGPAYTAALRDFLALSGSGEELA